MEDVAKILGQVPPHVKAGHCQRSKIEAVWRALGFSRTGLQTQVAGNLAERWLMRDESPRLPTNDPRKAAKRLEKCLSGETSLPFDLAMELINVLPGAYKTAARMLIFPSLESGAPGCIQTALRANAEADLATDRIRFNLADYGASLFSAEQLEAKAVAFDQEAKTCGSVADELRALAKLRKTTLRAV